MLQRDKLNNLVLFDKATYNKLYKGVPNEKHTIPAVVMTDMLKIWGFLAKAVLQKFSSKGLKLISRHKYQVIYIRNSTYRNA